MNAVHLGFFNTSSTRTHVGFQFSTHASAGGNVAPSSAFEAADIRIYKATDGAAFSATQRSSSNGITMTSPFDSLTGFHDVDIDLTDNTDAGFYAAGCRYSVVLAPDETIDSQTITAIVLAYFEIGRQQSDVREFGGAAGTFSSGRPEVNTTHLAGTSQTARDIGASVLLSSGTGTGQVKLSSGYVAPNWGDVGNPTTTVSLTNTTVATVTTTTTATNVTTLSSGAISEASFATTAGSFKPLGIIDQGTAQSATGTTLVIRSGASFADDELVGCIAWVPGQAPREITDYVSSTKTATIDPAWTTTPGGTPAYYIFANPPALSTPPDVNVAQISSDATAANNLEAAYDGTGYAHTGNTYPWTPAWDAEVQSECDDALVGRNLHTVAAIVANSAMYAAAGTIGSTGNDTTHVHIPGLGYSDDEPNDLLLVIRDVSAGEYHSRWVEDFVASTNLFTVATLPFTPEASTDTYQLFNLRRDVRAATHSSGLSFPSNFASLGINASGHVSRVTLTDTATSLTNGATLTSAYDFAKGTVAVTESYAADGAAPTPVQSLMLIQQMLTEKSISSTTMTVKKLDGSTSAATFTLNSSTSPTSITRAS